VTGRGGRGGGGTATDHTTPQGKNAATPAGAAAAASPPPPGHANAQTQNENTHIAPVSVPDPKSSTMLMVSASPLAGLGDELSATRNATSTISHASSPDDVPFTLTAPNAKVTVEGLPLLPTEEAPATAASATSCTGLVVYLRTQQQQQHPQQEQQGKQTQQQQQRRRHAQTCARLRQLPRTATPGRNRRKKVCSVEEVQSKTACFARVCGDRQLAS
jgi:hypothetical protein